MFYVIAFFAILYGLILKKGKWLTYFTLFFLWILFAFSFGNADYMIHLRRYTEYELLGSQTEWTYNKLMFIFNNLGCSYNDFLIVISAFILCVLYNFIKNHTAYISLVLSLYFIYPFCLDVTMVRYTLAVSIVYIGFKYLFTGGKNWFLKYSVCVFLASTIHLSTFFCLLFALPRFFSNKQLSKALLIFISIYFVIMNVFSQLLVRLTEIQFLNIGVKLKIVMNASSEMYISQSIFNYRAKMVIVLLISLFIYIVIYQWIVKQNIKNCLRVKKQIDFLTIACGINIITIIFILLLNISADLFRLQLSISLINYVAYAQYFDIRHSLGFDRKVNSMAFTTLVVIFGGIFLTCSSLYLWVLSSPNFISVFRALFENNILLN